MKKYNWILFVLIGVVIGQFIATAAEKVANGNEAQQILLTALASVSFLPICLLAVAAVLKLGGKR